MCCRQQPYQHTCHLFWILLVAAISITVRAVLLEGDVVRKSIELNFESWIPRSIHGKDNYRSVDKQRCNCHVQKLQQKHKSLYNEYCTKKQLIRPTLCPPECCLTFSRNGWKTERMRSITCPWVTVPCEVASASMHRLSRAVKLSLTSHACHHYREETQLDCGFTVVWGALVACSALGRTPWVEAYALHCGAPLDYTPAHPPHTVAYLPVERWGRIRRTPISIYNAFPMIQKNITVTGKFGRDSCLFVFSLLSWDSVKHRDRESFQPHHSLLSVTKLLL